MVHNRLVRALVGVLLAKVAVVGGWYLYQQVAKDTDADLKDHEDNAQEPVVEQETPAEVKPVVVKKTRAPRAKKVQAEELAPAAKKVARKSRAKKSVE